MLTPDAVMAVPFPVFEPGFDFSPWETTPVQFSLPEAQPPAQSPSLSHPLMTPNNSGSDEAEPDRTMASVEERRLRRMISNRESARRSRMRKQRHLEDLRNQVNRLRSENRDLANRLGAVTNHCLFFRSDNDRLRSESSVLRRRLTEIRQYLMFRHLQKLAVTPAAAACGGFASGNEQTLAAAACGGFGTGNEQTLIV